MAQCHFSIYGKQLSLYVGYTLISLKDMTLKQSMVGEIHYSIRRLKETQIGVVLFEVAVT